MAGTVARLAVRTPTPTLSIDSIHFSEASAEATEASFAVTLAPVSDRPVTVGFRTADATANDGSDYLGRSGTLTFAAGESQKTIPIPVIAETAPESDESFSVLLGNPVNAVIGDGWGVGTIENDDGPVVLVGTRSKSLLGSSLAAGSPLVYTITVSNSSNSTLGDNPGHELLDELPSDLTSISATATSGAVVTMANTVSWDGTILSGRSVTIRIDAVGSTVAEGTAITNQARISYDADLDGANEATVLTDDPAFQEPRSDELHHGSVARARVPSGCTMPPHRHPLPPRAPALLANGSREFLVTGHCGVPPTARALSVNVTATNQTVHGHLRLFPGLTKLPDASALNYGPHQTRANGAVVTLNPLGGLGIQCVQASGTVDVVDDVNGYFE